MASPKNPYKTHGCSWGEKQTPEYRSWQHARQRCTNPKATEYERYGGSGIKVCERWNDFAAFLSDMGPRPAGTSLDRIDSTKGYEPGNCRWATPMQQAWNTTKARLIHFNGKSQSQRAWARELCLAPPALRSRLKKWPLEMALSTPPATPKERVALGAKAKHSKQHTP